MASQRDSSVPSSAGARGIAYAASAAILFGSSYVATAFALKSFAPMPAAAWRGILGTFGLALLIVLRARASRPRVARSQIGRLAVLGCLGGPGIIVATNAAIGLVGPAVTSFVAGLYAVLAALAAVPVLHEPLRRPALAGFAMALVGVALLGQLDVASPSVLGLGLALLGACSYAAFLVLSRLWAKTYGLAPSATTFATVAATGIGLLAVEVVREPGALLPRSVSPEAVLGLVWVAAAAAVGQLLITASLSYIDTRRSAALLLLNPPSAALLAWLLLGQTLIVVQFAGAALILLGIAAASGLIRRSEVAAPSPTQSDATADG
jgi:drug/metabolite transporter (DMT)-like permease